VNDIHALVLCVAKFLGNEYTTFFDAVKSYYEYGIDGLKVADFEDFLN
jgi:hypothetical protein